MRNHNCIDHGFVNHELIMITAQKFYLCLLLLFLFLKYLLSMAYRGHVRPNRASNIVSSEASVRMGGDIAVRF